MIDFYKFSILSVMGKNAGSMSERDYLNDIITNYDKYKEKIAGKKRTFETTKER